MNRRDALLLGSIWRRKNLPQCCPNTTIEIVTLDSDTITFSGTGTVNDPLTAEAAGSSLLSSANNGLSLDGTIAVLGQDIGEVGNPATLTSNREIPMATFYLNFLNGKIGIGSVPTAKLHIAAGSATANTAPIKLISGALMTTAEVGAEEFLTDKRFFTITTGAARKEYTLNDIALTAGRVPFNTTNGRLTDSSTFAFSTGVNGPQISLSGTLTGGSPSPSLSIVETWNTTGAPVGISMLITDTASQTFNSYFMKCGIGATTLFSVRKDGGTSAGNPGGGSGIWKLGQIKAAASTLNTTQYIEIEVDGNLVKVATMN